MQGGKSASWQTVRPAAHLLRAQWGARDAFNSDHPKVACPNLNDTPTDTHLGALSCSPTSVLSSFSRSAKQLSVTAEKGHEEHPSTG